jgi:hypothetical protein
MKNTTPLFTGEDPMAAACRLQFQQALENLTKKFQNLQVVLDNPDQPNQPTTTTNTTP